MVPADEYREQQEGECSAECIGDGLCQMEALGSHEDVGGAGHGHPKAGDERHPIAFLLLDEPYGNGPEGEEGKRLVEPGKIAPQHL